MKNFDEIVLTPNGLFSLMDENVIFGTVRTLDNDVMDVRLFLN